MKNQRQDIGLVSRSHQLDAPLRDGGFVQSIYLASLHKLWHFFLASIRLILLAPYFSYRLQPTYDDKDTARMKDFGPTTHPHGVLTAIDFLSWRPILSEDAPDQGMQKTESKAHEDRSSNEPQNTRFCVLGRLDAPKAQPTDLGSLWTCTPYGGRYINLLKALS